MRGAKLLLQRAFIGLPLVLLVVGTSSVATRVHAEEPPGEESPGEARSRIFWSAVEYLRSQSLEAPGLLAGRGVLLPEALAADPASLGSRSKTLLSTLALFSLDAQSRRLRVLSSFGLDVADHVATIDQRLSLQRPRINSILAWTQRSDPLRAFNGNAGTSLPTALDAALALQAMHAAGTNVSHPTNGIQNALLYLLEFQSTDDGSWPLIRSGEAGAAAAIGDPLVTAEAVRALLLFQSTSFRGTYLAAANGLGIPTDIPSAIAAATEYLKSATYSNAASRSVSLLAFLEGAVDSSDSAILDAHNELLTMFDTDSGSFGNSPFATALAAQALSRASTVAAFAFDTDGDGISDAEDPDSDGDGYCDPGKSGETCQGEDAFPFDVSEQRDSDGDGVGDNADVDDDGDGIPDHQESLFQSDPLETADNDGDGIGDSADLNDDRDQLSDVEELLLGLDPNDSDTDGDSFLDHLEVAEGTDAADAGVFPQPDGDIFPMGSPDGDVDARDGLLGLRIAMGEVSVSPGAREVFFRHADVAPNGAEPKFDGADAVRILRKAAGIASW